VSEQLPHGWSIGRLTDVAELNPPPTVQVLDTTLVSFVPMAAVEEMTGHMDVSTSRQWSDVKKGFTRFQEGDVVLAKITPSMENGKVARAVNLTNGIGAGTTELHVFRPHPEIEGRYILHYLLRESFRLRARSRMTGTAGQLRVPAAFLEEQTLHVAPAPEQRRIVEAIDSYLSRVDAAVTTLERAHANLKAYRASLLKAAVEGCLVPTEAELARAEKREYEPAEVLLKRILAERRRRWEEAELANLKAAGTPPKDDKWRAKYKEPRAPDTKGLPELPAGWCWATLGQMAWSVKDGPHYSPRYVEHGIPFVTGGQVRPWGVDFDRAKRISENVHRKLSERVRPEIGDLLYTKGGTTGIARVNTYAQAFSVWVHVAVLKLAPSIHPFYLQHALNSPWCFAQAQGFTHGVGNQDLGLTRMVNIVLPLPPQAEQAKIVEEVDRLESVRHESTEIVKVQVQRARRLRQGILSWAFEGWLVDQDPHDEPAEKLLERIHVERAASAPAKRPPEQRVKVAT
jgi:type I restriction enzyme S subunit